jgi:hypothetical protein
MSLLAITFMPAADCFLQMEALQLPTDNATISDHTLLAHLTQQNRQVTIQTLHCLISLSSAKAKLLIESLCRVYNTIQAPAI